jgi:hypothetical protein
MCPVSRHAVRFVVLAFVPAAYFSGPSRADVVLLGVATLPGDSADLSGLSGKASDGTPNDRLGSLGSGIAYTGGDEYVLVNDRGPKDGASDFACRFHRMTVRVSPGAKESVTAKLTATVLLTTEGGKRFVGDAGAFEHKEPEKNLRLDPEGVRVGRDGAIYVSDEYGPVIYEFDAEGKRLRSIPVPAHFRPAKPGKSSADELPPKNTVGRQPNRGMEGLAISPDGTKLYGLMQSPLIQDGALDAENKRVGVNCRLLEVELATGKSREFVYRLDAPGLGTNEILAVGDHEFLVIERDGKAGKDAACKKIFRIDIAGATDVSGVAALPAGALPAGITPVKKVLFLDLLAPSLGIAGKNCPDKFEGLAFGPDLPDGRHLLLVTTDNDFLAEQPTRVYAFAVGTADLPGYRPQQFTPRR